MHDVDDTDTLPGGIEFHHIGYACPSLIEEKQWFECIGFRIEGEPFEDHRQGISGCFMAGVGPRVELLENIMGRDTLTPWLSSGIRMYHLAYLVSDVDVALAWVSTMRARVVVQPTPAVAFGGQRIAFAMLRNGLLLEFIDRGMQGI